MSRRCWQHWGRPVPALAHSRAVSVAGVFPAGSPSCGHQKGHVIYRNAGEVEATLTNPHLFLEICFAGVRAAATRKKLINL